MDKRVSFFDLELALTQGYVHEPHGGGFASFGDERTSCSVYYQALKERRYEAEPCAVKCALCQQVGDTTDYIRGFRQRNGKREVAKPHYPVPAIPTKVHYVYQPGNWVGNGVLIRVRGVVKAGAWADGLPMEPLPNWVCQFCGGMDHSEDCCPM